MERVSPRMREREEGVEGEEGGAGEGVPAALRWCTERGAATLHRTTGDCCSRQSRKKKKEEGRRKKKKKMEKGGTVKMPTV